ncbi:hypothetical protein TRFO_21566 [Tritrichomonas foetus]|uniref:Uncharacterized protein n=1 Tax=Tritrichomonas foetus TaxID=1144522 RepID=A0A1J4KDK3_9EUKA|nr:hypothetical protein TRFO_21566 [Tritrichomonas foetus]|eukprot:OHT09519.1 hypothetical protein TRFO_21566 [Tritrichomonas foetus]
MSSCFILPSDFSALDLSNALEDLLEENPSQGCRIERPVDYNLPPTFQDPFPISDIDLAITDTPHESYFITFSTRSARLQTELKDQVEYYRNYWNSLVMKKNKEADALSYEPKKKGIRAKMLTQPNTPVTPQWTDADSSSTQTETSTSFSSKEESMRDKDNKKPVKKDRRDEEASRKKGKKDKKKSTKEKTSKKQKASKNESKSKNKNEKSVGKDENKENVELISSFVEPSNFVLRPSPPPSPLGNTFADKISKLNVLNNLGGAPAPMQARQQVRARVSLILPPDVTEPLQDSLQNSGQLDDSQAAKPPPQIVRCGRRRGTVRPPTRATEGL